eukprot:jgi/Mesvir1/19272/Mv10352-RA.1
MAGSTRVHAAKKEDFSTQTVNEDGYASGQNGSKHPVPFGPDPVSTKPEKRPHIAPFVKKLYTILNDPSTHSIIDWCPGGKSFKVPDRYKFEQEGFRKLSDCEEYWHPNFQHGQHSLLKFLLRSDSKQASRNVPASQPTSLPSPVPPPLPALVPAPAPAPEPAPAVTSLFEPHGKGTACADASLADLEAKVHHLDCVHACMAARMEEQDRMLRENVEMLRAMKQFVLQMAARCYPAVAEACKEMGGDHAAMWHLLPSPPPTTDSICEHPRDEAMDNMHVQPEPAGAHPGGAGSRGGAGSGGAGIGDDAGQCRADGAHACFNAQPGSSSEPQPQGVQMEAGPVVAESGEEASGTVTVGVGGTGGLAWEAGNADADACPGTPIEAYFNFGRYDQDFPPDVPMPTDNGGSLCVPLSVDAVGDDTVVESLGVQKLPNMQAGLEMGQISPQDVFGAGEKGPWDYDAMS